ncbi:hypothetical protein Tco_1370098 [Tanacetum coccineum]
MANLEFCNKHNMVAYLKKSRRSEGFQEIVDFLNGSHIRYSLTKNPIIYVSLIKKFWQTATVRTIDNGEQEITTSVDGKEFTITEASLRIHLQSADVDGISVLPTTKFFDQLSLMGELVQVVVLGAKKPWGVLLLRLGVTLVTPTQREDQPEDQLGVLSAAKVLADATKTNVHTYTRRRRAVSTKLAVMNKIKRNKIAARKEKGLMDLKQLANIRARIKADEERKKYFAAQKAKAKRNKPMTQAQQRNYMINYIKHMGKVGSSKRDAEAKLDHEGSKRQKTNEASGSVQEQPDKEEKELSQEDLQQMMMVVPVKEVYVEAL